MTVFQLDRARAERATRALLVSVVHRGKTAAGDGEDRAAEWRELARSAGFEIVATAAATIARPDPALFLGSGKVEQLAAAAEESGAGIVLVDAGLSAIQQRNLETRFEKLVLDRPALILDIFAQRARSSEGKVQVELARLEHLATRLVRGWTHLERQRGGIGLRGGPGEKQLELDRRMIGVRTRQLRARLEALHRQRQTRRKARTRRGVFSVSLVGYTNAGKSTLFNALAGAHSPAADQLFATLDPLARRIHLDDRLECVLTDTVGFIRELPPQLVAAFKSTLEESADADLLLHVIDGASPARAAQMAEVERILDEIGAGAVPRIAVYNKMDRAGLPAQATRDPCGTIAAVFLSALTGDGIGLLRSAIAERAAEQPARDRTIDLSADRDQDQSEDQSEDQNEDLSESASESTDAIHPRGSTSRELL